MDLTYTFLKRKVLVDGDTQPALKGWIDEFKKNKEEAALHFWYEMHMGIQESLKEF